MDNPLKHDLGGIRSGVGPRGRKNRTHSRRDRGSLETARRSAARGRLAGDRIGAAPAGDFAGQRPHLHPRRSSRPRGLRPRAGAGKLHHASLLYRPGRVRGRRRRGRGAERGHAGERSRCGRSCRAGPRARASRGRTEVVRRAPQDDAHAHARGRSPPHAPELLLRPGGSPARAPGAPGLDVVGLTAPFHLRFFTRAAAQHRIDDRSVGGDVRGAPDPARFPGLARVLLGVDGDNRRHAARARHALDGDERESAEPGLQRDRQLPVPLAVAVAADRGALRPSRRRGSPPQARRVDEGQGARLAEDRRAARSGSQPAPRHRLVGVRGFLLGA